MRATEARPIAATLRQLHRSIAIVLVLFITVIGLTGSFLQGVLAVYGEPGPGGIYRPAAAMPATVAALRATVLSIHTGFVAGILGAYYGLVCGLGLFFFSVSGLWMYLELYRGRARLGRQTIFWATKVGADATMRSLHRWFTVGLVLFTTFISFTGFSLDFDFARNNMIPGNGPRPGGPPPGPRGPPPSGAAWHELNFTIHKLDFLGTAGHVLGIFIGLGLATMAISGFWMYLAMLGRRAKAGQKGFFW